MDTSKNQTVLVLNCGSSSLKFAIINPESGQQYLSGLAEALTLPEAQISWRFGEDGDKQKAALPAGADHTAALTFLERKRPTERQDVDWIARQESKLIRGLEYMAEQLGEHAWCMGTHFSLADIASGCALGYLAFRFPEIDWSVKHPNLARLYDKLMQRQAFADTIPKV